MSQELRSFLLQALQRLEKADRTLESEQGYNEDLEILRMVIELTREQVPIENTRSTPRAAR